MKIGFMGKVRKIKAVFKKKNLSKLDRMLEENTKRHQELVRLTGEYLKFKNLKHEKQ